MAQRTYAIMGATGQIGHVVAGQLLKRGHAVRAIARDQGKLAKLSARGAAPHAVAFDDAQALTRAFSGVTAVFTMIPPGYTAPDFGAAQDKVGEATVQAIKQAKVTHVVDLSSVGAQRPDGTGPIKGLYRQEQRLNAVAGLNVVHLRPSSFMQNQYWSIPTIKQLNVNGSPMRGDLPQDMVSTEDIGTKAAELLDQLAFRGQSVVELAGPAPLTLQEATTVLGKAIGKPDLKYVQFPADEARKAMLGMGMSASAVDLMLEMEESFNKELIRFERPPAKGTTSFQEFAKSFARAYLSPEPAAV